MKMTWAAGVVVLVLAAAAVTAGAQVGVSLDWEWESDHTPKAPTRWLAATPASGPVYCTGRVWASSSSTTAIALWRVDPDSSTAWTVTIFPTGSTDCNGTAVTAIFDPNQGTGRVWVTGYVDGTNGYDIYTACYEDNGASATLVWEDRYNNTLNGANGDDVPIGILYDEHSGILFVGGDSDGVNSASQSTGKDILVLAYSAAGSDPPSNPPLWPMRHNGTGDGDDHFADFKALYFPVQESESTSFEFVGLYVAGTAWNGSTKNDFVALKVDIEDGEIELCHDFNYDGSGHDICTCMDAGVWARDEENDVFIGGVFLGGYTNGLTTEGDDYLTVALDLGLSDPPLWTDRYPGPGGGSDRIAKIIYWATAFHANRSVTVTGESLGDGTGFDFATIRYDDEGEVRWGPVRFDNLSVNGDDRATDMAVDLDGNVFVAGFSENITAFSTPTLDIAAISYVGTNGSSRWLDFSTMNDFVIYNGSANGADRGAAIRLSVPTFQNPVPEVFVFGGVTASVGYTTLSRHAVVKWVQSGSGP